MIFSFGTVDAPFFSVQQPSVFVVLNERSPFLKCSSRGLRAERTDSVIMGGEEGLGVTTGQPNLYKQDLSKLVSVLRVDLSLESDKLSS